MKGMHFTLNLSVMSIDESTGTHISMMEKVALKDHSLND
jgi:hypothetical protein